MTADLLEVNPALKLRNICLFGTDLDDVMLWLKIPKLDVLEVGWPNVDD